MEDNQSTTARLRKTFRFPADESQEDDDTPDVMDEEVLYTATIISIYHIQIHLPTEQETFIASLADQNRARNGQFRHLLLALPCISCVPYILNLVLGRATAAPTSLPPLLSLLALSSLASTAFLIWRLPPDATGIAALDAFSSPARQQPYGVIVGEKSPLETWLPYLNAGLCVLVAVLGYLNSLRVSSRYQESSSIGGVAGVGGFLPAAIYAVVLVAKTVMAGVDPERELGGLRYEYKGA
ncbi:hypothetical protein B0T17DRAFT_568887 [Bombardia bombarda]|uniref:Uncharacterized protein n=1 Tax=Bombardia bombarda TaxID=252184 RepID=A0AA39XKU4_9PEZI|nr:hypothetical protein B0T17DRAFT_568887 [Bombardia bombarda]